MRHLPTILLLCVGLAAPVSSNGGAADDLTVRAETAQCATEAALAVQRHYESVRDLAAGFEQSTRSVALGTGAAAGTSRSSGQVVFAKPGRMRWSYEQPQPSLVVSDGETLWIYDPDAREAQRLPVTQGYLTGAALAFLIGEGDLLAEYVVSTQACGGELIELDLVPRSDASYERLGLRVVRATGEVRATRIIDLFGNITEVSFRDLRLNVDPPAATFGFDSPAGVRVIDLAQ
jgi:outer membrane lipoprotein carrier protein